MKRFRRHGQESQRDRLKQELFQFTKASEAEQSTQLSPMTMVNRVTHEKMNANIIIGDNICNMLMHQSENTIKISDFVLCVSQIPSFVLLESYFNVVNFYQCCFSVCDTVSYD